MVSENVAELSPGLSWVTVTGRPAAPACAGLPGAGVPAGGRLLGLRAAGGG